MKCGFPDSLAFRLLLPCAFLLSGCTGKQHSRSLTNDVYVWQRHWSNTLLTALKDSASTIRTWRILAAELDPGANWIEVSVNRPVLKQMAKSVIAVVRIDGRRGGSPLQNQLAMHIAALAMSWKEDGVPVTGIEIDYDCATDRLPEYRKFIHFLRTQLRTGTSLSITALPSWMGSRYLPDLFAEVDETVLQLHSVMSPQKGLFDRAVAYRWSQAWSRLSPMPFRIALPTYWSRVTWNENGRVISIESEVPRNGTDLPGRELIVEPAEVSSLVAALQQAPLPHLSGIAWFRLPTAEDGRAWTIGTWQAVMRGQSLHPAPLLVRFKPGPAGAEDVFLFNGSGLDVTLPAQVSLSALGCEWADALPPYNLEQDAAAFRFRLQSNNLLRAGEERPIGWVRCSGKDGKVHASL